MLQALGPPDHVSDIFSAHMFEVLNFQVFATWSMEEKAAVLSVLDVLTRLVDEDVEEIRDALANVLIREQRQLPP